MRFGKRRSGEAACALRAERRQSRRIPVLACLLQTCLALSACGGSGEPSTDARPSRTSRPPLEKVCDLVRGSEAEAISGGKIGKPYDPPKKGALAYEVIGMQSCYFDGADGGPSITLGLATTFASQVFEKFVATEKAKGTEVVAVKNIGDKAVWTGNSLYVLEDGFLLAVGVRRQARKGGSSTPEAARLAAWEPVVTLATQALERLPGRDRS